jgi:hypothetical protein
MKKTLIFPKTHGRSDWKNVSKEGIETIIFTGNYFDSSRMLNENLIDNFLEIVKFARENDNVILLLGDHDLQYLENQPKTLGYREDGALLFRNAIIENTDLFLTEWTKDGVTYKQQSAESQDGIIPLIEEKYYIDGVEFPLIYKIITQNPWIEKPYEYNIVDGFKVGIYAPYMFNIDQSVIDAQKRVFDLFNIKINQIFWEKQHADFMNHLTRTENVDFFIFFDIDSIPLRPDFLEYVIRETGKDKIMGVEQVSAHVPGYEFEPFAAPACFIISRDLYHKMGMPPFDVTYRGDDTQELTYIANETGIPVRFIRFTHCEELHYHWKFKDGRQYGFGNTYEDLVFHNFESRFNEKLKYFFDKCEEVIAKYS